MDGRGDDRRAAAAAGYAAGPPTPGATVVAATQPAVAVLPAAVFTQGSIVRHVVVMTGTSTVGIMAIFVVDLLSLLYVARLGQTALTAAVGYATQILFLAVSVNIGLTIGVTAVVARALGAGDRRRARRLAGSGIVYATVLSTIVAAAVLAGAHALLTLLGARGEAAAVAARFLDITLPANVLLGVGMVLSGILRAVGDARRAMMVTLTGGILTGILDPILIFGLHLGVYGAAISIVVARFALLGTGLWPVLRVHDLLQVPSLAVLRADLGPVLGVAAPAVATNLATPVGNGYALHVFSSFGSEAVAAVTITDRLVPVAFGVLFALSGAVGPILAQNLGAGRFERVRGTLSTAFLLTVVYVLAVWALLWLAAPLILRVFDASPEASRYIVFFCQAGVSAWLFLGFLYVANASFNNLGFAWLSMLFNWGRASLGTIPFVTLGAAYAGVIGGQVGMAAGAAVFGLAALITAYRVVGRLAKTAVPS